jgi:hypothetical protein
MTLARARDTSSNFEKHRRLVARFSTIAIDKSSEPAKKKLLLNYLFSQSYKLFQTDRDFLEKTIR